MAVLVAIEPDIVTSSKCRPVHVELAGKHSRGLVLVDWDEIYLKEKEHRKIEIILDLDQERTLAKETDCLK